MKCCRKIEYCCDMRGMLSFIILWLLSKKAMYGQEIAKEIERMRGGKPTPGTLYPALKELEKKNLIKRKEKGRKCIYQLTKNGRSGTKKVCSYFCRMFGELFMKNFVLEKSEKKGSSHLRR